MILTMRGVPILQHISGSITKYTIKVDVLAVPLCHTTTGQPPTNNTNAWLALNKSNKPKDPPPAIGHITYMLTYQWMANKSIC